MRIFIFHIHIIEALSRMKFYGTSRARENSREMFPALPTVRLAVRMILLIFPASKKIAVDI